MYNVKKIRNRIKHILNQVDRKYKPVNSDICFCSMCVCIHTIYYWSSIHNIANCFWIQWLIILKLRSSYLFSGSGNVICSYWIYWNIDNHSNGETSWLMLYLFFMSNWHIKTCFHTCIFRNVAGVHNRSLNALWQSENLFYIMRSGNDSRKMC